MQATFIGQSVRPVSDLIRQARQGVLRRRVDEVAHLVGLTDKEMARILNMSVRSIHGKQATEALTLAAGERLLLFEGIVQRGLAVFDGRADLVGRWLRTPLAELSYAEGPDEASVPLSTRQFGSFNEPTDLASEPARLVAGDGIPLSSGSVPQSPLSVLDTVSGFSLVDDVLGRIEWGIIG